MPAGRQADGGVAIDGPKSGRLKLGAQFVVRQLEISYKLGEALGVAVVKGTR